ncbi:MAG: molybdopterin biosynthesis protein [Firmicutes bacterium HGW-Firmicutes-15]|nr:MAG: molybdopterin biosynthesis protein [Firmicutes bacterium HGW-Firmicutes-15]
MARNIYIENMPLEKALALFMEHLKDCKWFQLESEEIDVLSSLGRWTAEPVLAGRSSPHYMASAMDGIAVQAASTYHASEVNPINLALKEILVVDTGDYVPPEYDAVIMIEDVNFINDQVQIIKPAVPWQHIRSIGEDLVEQDMIVPSLSLIGPYELASFRTASVNRVQVIKKPVVAIIPTGTELIETGNANMTPGQIVESNSRMLAGLCQEWGAEALRHEIVIDDKELIRQAVVEMGKKADLIIICSGSSAGREDYTSTIVQELGHLIVHGLATRPGKPAILGIIDEKPVIGVPGYPISAQLIFSLFARPILFRKIGQEVPDLPSMECSISRKLPSHAGVDEFVNVNVARISGQPIAYPLNRGAGLSSILVKSDGVVHIPRGNEGLDAGSSCQVILNRSPRVIDNTLVCLGSHDMSIDFLIDILQREQGLRMVSTNVGSMGGIMSLSRRETHCAGLHLLDYDSGDYNVSYLKKYLPQEKLLLINLVKRHQGLVVKKGNPLHIQGIKDLSRPEIRFINRQKGAGTRLLLDYLLNREKLSSQDINGYNREEYTHLAVASSVKNDGCDTGLAIYASAKVMNLDFIPIEVEHYDLCILPDLLSKKQLDGLLAAIHSPQFRARVTGFGGYELDLSGQTIYEYTANNMQ